MHNLEICVSVEFGSQWEEGWLGVFVLRRADPPESNCLSVVLTVIQAEIDEKEVRNVKQIFLSESPDFVIMRVQEVFASTVHYQVEVGDMTEPGPPSAVRTNHQGI